MGVLINGLVIIVFSLVGLLLRGGIQPRIHERLMQGIALCILTIGIQGTISGKNTIVMILSMIVGTYIGERIDIDKAVTNGIHFLELKFVGQKKEAVDNQFGQAFISAVMIFCIGSMAILGSLEAGLQGDNTTLYTKSILDGITALLLASSLGVGVAFSSIPVVIVEGCIMLMAQVLAPILSDAVVTEIVSVGSLLLIALALNIMNVTNFKVLNHIPAMLLPPVFIYLLSFLM